MHVGVIVGTVVTIAAALISSGIFLWYSIQGGGDTEWLYRMAVTLAVAGLTVGVSVWMQLRRFRKDYQQFRDEVKSRLAIQDLVEGDQLMRAFYPEERR